LLKKVSLFEHSSPTPCGRTVSGSISLPSPGFFSPFPHGTMRYRSPRVFSLRRWSAQIRAGFPCPTLLGSKVHRLSTHFAYGALTSLAGLPRPFGYVYLAYGKVAAFPDLIPLPLCGNARELLHHTGLGSSPFAHHYSGNRISLSFPQGTKMFQFPGSLPKSFPLGILRHYPEWVSPFGHPRIIACSQLPGAFRRLPRPSSPLVPRHPPYALSTLTPG